MREIASKVITVRPNELPTRAVFLNPVPGESKTSDGEFPRLLITNTTLLFGVKTPEIFIRNSVVFAR